MHSRNLFRLVLAAMLTLGLEMALAGPNTSIREIKNSLTCTCDCSMTVEACEGSMACEAAAQLTEQAQRLLAAGLDHESILASFVARYGETILAAPTKTGFNLLAWVMPFIALAMAMLGVVQMLRHWACVNADPPPAHKVASKLSSRNGDYEKRLNQMLHTLD